MRYSTSEQRQDLAAKLEFELETAELVKEYIDANIKELKEKLLNANIACKSE